MFFQCFYKHVLWYRQAPEFILMFICIFIPLENGPPVYVTSRNLTISDADIGSAPLIHGAIVYISEPIDTNFQHNTTEEYLTFSLPSSTIRQTYTARLFDPQNSNTVRYIQIAFSGASSINLYQGLLRSIRFQFN